MKSAVWGLVLLLVVLHHDLWFWNDDRLVFGFLPITLAYHAGISLAAGITWFLAIQFAWPPGLDGETIAEAADPGDPEPQEGGAA